MPERTDKYEDLTPHHRRHKSEAELAFEGFIATHKDPTLKDAFIAGWNEARQEKMYSLEEIKEIIN